MKYHNINANRAKADFRPKHESARTLGQETSYIATHCDQSRHSYSKSVTSGRFSTVTRLADSPAETVVDNIQTQPSYCQKQLLRWTATQSQT